MNKKGVMGMIPKIFAVVMAMIVIAVVLNIIFSQKDDVLKLSTKEDFDGDKFNDGLDTCPCGGNDNKVDINGISLCQLTAKDIETVCTCANNLANYDIRKNLEGAAYNDYKTRALFVYGTPDKGSSKVCTYDSKSCAHLIDQYPDFYGDLRVPKNPCDTGLPGGK